MSSHDRYLELGALAVIGQISADEDRELAQHLFECHECREAYSDYSAILHNHLPSASPVRYRLKNEFVPTSRPAEIRERFLARARSEGAEFSDEVEIHQQSHRSPIWGIHFGQANWALITSAAAVVISFVILVGFRKTAPPKTVVTDTLPRVASRQAQPESETGTGPVQAAESRADNESALRAQIRTWQTRLNESNQRAKILQDRLNTLSAQNAFFSEEHVQDEAQISSLRDQLAHEKDSSAAVVAGLVTAQEKVKSLNDSVAEKSQRLAMEQQLNSVSSDVRQLMGARNLHIVDVYDANASGEATKSFGRVFYAEGQSLVFYAFDLPSRKLTPAKYTFQAWGQQEDVEHSVRNLGTFEVDDHEQRRWVLKVKNATLLKDIDSVFVTAETLGDSTEPHGKKLLYAYLAGRANHP